MVDGESQGTYLVLDILQTIQGPVARLYRVDLVPQTTSLAAVDRLTLKSAEVVTAKDAICLVALRDLKRPWAGPPVAAFSCRTDFKPYQFRPLMKYFGDAGRRILIADETGLGKTVEAGYILVEEVARSGASRLLILCPPRLRHKWKAEMWRRFGLPFQVVGGPGLLRALESLGTPFLHIASMDCARTVDLDRIKRITPDRIIDVLVIDEVHRMIGRGEETLRRELGLALSCISRGVVGLSATPVHLEVSDLKRVLDVISPGSLDDGTFPSETHVTALVNRARRILDSGQWEAALEGQLRACIEELDREARSLHEQGRERVQAFVEATRIERHLQDSQRRRDLRQRGAGGTLLLRLMNRTRAVEVGEDRKRIVISRRVPLSIETRSAFQGEAMVSTSEEALYREVDRLLKESFSHVHRRQLSSSLPAMVGLLRGGMEGFTVWQARVPDDEAEPATPSGRRLSEGERAACRRLADLYGLLRRDSKWEALAVVLRELQGSCRKAIVFTHWIPTYRHLAKRAQALGNIPMVLVPPGSRDEEVEEAVLRFQRHEGFAVLLATDLLREGLDLDAADCVVNYDFPYNPQEIEQRIGRVDRVGQKSSEVRVVNLLVEGSLDQEIYDRVLSRIGVFERAVGDMRPIVQEMAEELERRGTIDEEEVVRVVAQLEDRRRLMEHEAFLAVEDALDDDIKAAHRSRLGGLEGLHRMVLEQFFHLLCPGCRCAWDPGEASLTVQGLTPEAEEAILSLAGPSDREIVMWALSDARDDQGALRLRLGGGRGGLPMTHPLVRAGVDVVSKSYAGPGQSGEVGCLVVEGPLPDAGAGAKALGLMEYIFVGEHVHERRWKWWAMGDGGAATPVEDSRTGGLLEAIATAARADRTPTEFDVATGGFIRASEGDFRDWAEAIARREAGLRRASMARSLQAARFRLSRIAKGGESPAGDPSVEALRERVEAMQEELGREEGQQSFLRFVPMASRQVALIVRAEGGA